MTASQYCAQEGCVLLYTHELPGNITIQSGADFIQTLRFGNEMPFMDSIASTVDNVLLSFLLICFLGAPESRFAGRHIWPLIWYMLS
jgi:hypothetical protein